MAKSGPILPGDPRGRPRHWPGKLTLDQVLEIRTLRGKLPAHKVAVRYGMEEQAIYRLWRGETWRHVTTDLGRDGEGPAESAD